MGPQGTGALLSPTDYRDKIAAASATPSAQLTLPSNFTTSVATPMYQRQIPACVAHSIVDILKHYWFVKTGKWIDFSPRFLDILSAEADIPLDGGRRPRTVLKVAFSKGCATTATLPNDTTLPIAQYRNLISISPAAYAEALQYKIPGYISVVVGKDSTRIGLMNWGPLSTLFSVGEELWVPSWLPKDTDPLRTPQMIVSGHQMTAYGWTDAGLNNLQNEWSTDWANGGRTHYDPLKWQPFTYEQWGIAKIPDDVTQLLKNLPAATDFHYNWSKDLKIGDVNDDVKFAQIAYMILGFLGPVAPDELGIFGPKTAAANVAFQSSHKITPTAANNIGPKTRAALNLQFS